MVSAAVSMPKMPIGDDVPQPASKDAVVTVKTAGRTLDVFEAFAEAGEPLSLTELAERLEAPLSSCHGLMRTLLNRGYVYLVDERRKFYPSKRLLEIATDIARHDPLLRYLAQAVTELRDATGETVIIGKRQGDEVVYLQVIEGTHLIRYREVAGARKPLHSSAIGKAILGSLDDTKLLHLLRRLTLPAITDRTIVDVDRLLAEICTSRSRGYFRTEGENVADVQALAVLCRVQGEILAVAVAGPVERMRVAEADYVETLQRQVGLAQVTHVAPL